jgi:hypothetical protein
MSMVALKTLTTAALANFALPGEAGFPLGAVYERPKDRTEAGTYYIDVDMSEAYAQMPCAPT